MNVKRDNKNLNLYKYALIVFLFAIKWAFIGGILIAQDKNGLIKIGAMISSLGSLSSFLVFDYLLKKKKWNWFYF